MATSGGANTGQATPAGMGPASGKDDPGAGGAAGAGTRTTSREPPADKLADELAKLGGPAREQLAEILRQLGAVDRAVYNAIADVPTPSLDEALRLLSNSANNSRLWLAIAAALALTGPGGRRAALRGVLAIGVTSATVNLGVKSLSARRRPDREGAGVPGARQVEMPASTSFPSGHSASAFAFATAVGRDHPLLAVAMQFLAGSVAYSRVHTGVHYPGDVVVGALIGVGTGQAVCSLLDRALTTRRSPGAEAH
jgi:membrane-associated phospholipid phosphatase